MAAWSFAAGEDSLVGDARDGHLLEVGEIGLEAVRNALGRLGQVRFNCSSSAVLPWAADSGRSVAPVACSEILVHASAALAKPPRVRTLRWGSAWWRPNSCEPAADDGALPACGAEQPVRARAARRAAAVRGRAIFFEVTLQNHFSVEIAPPARTGLPAALVFFPQRASLARPADRPQPAGAAVGAPIAVPRSRRAARPMRAVARPSPSGHCAVGLPVDCSVTALLTRQKGTYGAIDQVLGKKSTSSQ